MKRLNSARDVVAALGGLEAVAELTGRNYKSVSHWQAQIDRFPATTYILMMTSLAALGYTAPARLWGQLEAADA